MTVSDYRGASSARLKAARRLTKRALRQRERAFLAEGPQAVSEALATGARVTGLFVTAPAQARHAGLVAQAADAGVDVQVVSGEVMSELAQTVTPQGLLGGFTRLHLATGEFPLQGVRLRALTLPDENVPVALEDRRHNLNHPNIGA